MPKEHTTELDHDKTGVFLAGFTPRREGSDNAHYLVVIEGEAQGRRLELGAQPITLGRHPDCELCLPDPCISKQHCVVSLRANLIWVDDLDSTNGTFLEDRKLASRAVWPEGTVLRIGGHALKHEYRNRKSVEEAEHLALDLQKARAYVQSLLPPPLADGPVRVDWHFAPTAVLGGDSFGYGWLDGEHFAFYLVDVCGHGVGPAMHSVSVLNVLRHRSLVNVDFADPAQVLDKLNAAMPMEDHGDMFFSIWYGVYRTRDRRLVFASGGHPPALLLSQEQPAARELHAPNLYLGMMPGGKFEDHDLTLAPDSTLCVFSDGVFEFTTRTGEDWSFEAFRALVEERAGTGVLRARDIHREVTGLARGGKLRDDFSLMILRFP